MMRQSAQRKTPQLGREGRLRFALQVAEQAKRVGGRIAELRREKKWSKAELARQLPGVSSGNDIRRWERGDHLPRADTLDAIAGALETNVADLYSGPMASRKSKAGAPDLMRRFNGSRFQLDRIEQRLIRIEAALGITEAGPAEIEAEIAALDLGAEAEGTGETGERPASDAAN